ncbi:hypothetical protein [Amycolatopsis albispora]|uniref:hypothetical protein n=1 Tax=Amycolatopsis albispora TaxID=1804986 RepID=UPI0013B38280|nr:hypothetical protein [Amycolatopsis albispora]
MEEADLARARLAALEREAADRSVTDRHVRFYPAIAAALIALSVLPVYRARVTDTIHLPGQRLPLEVSRTEMLWGHPESGGTAVAFVLVLLLAWATVNWRSAVPPALVAIAAAVLLVLLLGKQGIDPGHLDIQPGTVELAPAGVVSALVCPVLMLAGLAHAVDVWNRRHRVV